MERVTFDGECPACRGWARRIGECDPAGARFLLDPGGAGSDTVVVETADGRRLVRSDAVIHLLRATGRTKTAALLALVPRPLRDLGYRAFARLRRRNHETCKPPDAP
jgi:predicted DCC family thiol-disulfide oxidoreductase YuxK